MYILCAPFSARAVAIIFPIPSRGYRSVSSGQELFVKEGSVAQEKNADLCPPPVMTATRPSTLNKSSTRRVLLMSSLADGMLKLWVMSQQPEGSNHKVMTSCDDASTLKSKQGQYLI